jgi:hypothetical protein
LEAGHLRLLRLLDQRFNLGDTLFDHGKNSLKTCEMRSFC